VGIDTSGMSQADAQQVAMFEMLLDSLPVEGLKLLRDIVAAKIDEKGPAA